MTKPCHEATSFNSSVLIEFPQLVELTQKLCVLEDFGVTNPAHKNTMNKNSLKRNLVLVLEEVAVSLVVVVDELLPDLCPRRACQWLVLGPNLRENKHANQARKEVKLNPKYYQYHANETKRYWLGW